MKFGRFTSFSVWRVSVALIVIICGSTVKLAHSVVRHKTLFPTGKVPGEKSLINIKNGSFGCAIFPQRQKGASKDSNTD